MHRRFLLLLVLVLLLDSAGAIDTVIYDVYMVWDAKCLENPRITNDTYLLAPGNDGGKPDMTNAHLIGMKIRTKRGCERIEVRKVAEFPKRK